MLGSEHVDYGITLHFQCLWSKGNIQYESVQLISYIISDTCRFQYLAIPIVSKLF